MLAAAPPHYLFLPISLNSLDLAGVRLLSPRDSQILPKQLQVLMIPVQVTQPELKEELDEDRVHCLVSFLVDQ